MSCGVGCRRDLNLALLGLWRMPTATAPIRPPAWEPPYAAEAALEKAKRQKKKSCGSPNEKRHPRTHILTNDFRRLIGQKTSGLGYYFGKSVLRLNFEASLTTVLSGRVQFTCRTASAMPN